MHRIWLMWPGFLAFEDHAMSELLNLSRQARRLGVTQQWLREQADAGQLPCLKAGKRYLFNPEAVETALSARAARTRQGGSDGK
jgi:excisionase family DNA binding protein